MISEAFGFHFLFTTMIFFSSRLAPKGYGVVFGGGPGGLNSCWKKSYGRGYAVQIEKKGMVVKTKE